jgi:hypothetical protein
MNVLSPDDSVEFWQALETDAATGKITLVKTSTHVDVLKAETPVMHQPLPVLGYTTQSTNKTDKVNAMKLREEKILRVLDTMREDPEIDQRWLSIGRTSLEQAFMAINRSVFNPQRIDLPDNAAYGEKEV